MQVSPEKIQDDERSDVTMTYHVTGNPPPDQATWSKSQGSLPNSRNIVSQGTLTISVNLTTDDSGSYVCTARNIWGTTSSPVQLRVYTSLEFINKPPSSVIFES